MSSGAMATRPSTHFWSLGLVRGLIGGVIAWFVGMGVVMAGRAAFGLTPLFEPEPVFVGGGVFFVMGMLIGVGAFNDWFSWARGGPVGDPEHADPDAPQWPRYFSFDASHKIIGIQYCVTSVLTMFLGGIFALTFRTELARPGMQFLSMDTYNTLLSLHGIVMIAAILLGVAGMANYLLPLQLGAHDMAFPRLNALSYWLALPGVILVALALPFGGFDTGWTGYPPLGTVAPIGIQFFYFGVWTVGLSSILGSANFLTTIFRMRAPGMTLFRMPIFVWGMLATSIISLFGTQFIGMAFLMVMLERLLGMGFFTPIEGNPLSGDPVLFQHIFWFYSHPAVYVFILPGLGVISELLPVFTRKPLFGYRWVALSSMFIALVGFLVWAHHMFAVGLSVPLTSFFTITTMLVAVPTGVKFFSWLATMWEGKMTFPTPMLFVIGAFLIFLLGGLSGPQNALLVTDLYLHETYWVVAHFHHTMFGGFVFPFLAAIYFWFPKATGRMYDETLGKLHFWLMFVGFFVVTTPMFRIGLKGMRRRIADYDPALGFESYQSVTTLGAWVIGFSLLIFAYNMVRSVRYGEKSVENPWNARSLEWQISSPPPELNYETQIVVVGEPYDYGLEDAPYTAFGVDPDDLPEPPSYAQLGSAEGGTD